MTLIGLGLGMLQAGSFDMSTTISVALLVVVVGAVWRLSALLTRIEDKLQRLKNTPNHLRHMELHLIAQEEDLNNLWAATRSDDPAKVLDVTRRTRYQPFPIDGA